MRYRLTALTVAAVLALSLVLSLFYIETHADHHCCGEGCSVCAVIGLCKQRLNAVGTAAAQLTAVAGLITAALIVCGVTCEGYRRPSPAKLGVELLN